MTELMTPATLLGPMWFHGRFEPGRLSLYQGHVWFEPGTFIQREPGRLWFQHHPTSKRDIVIPIDKVRAKTPWFTWGCGLLLHALADGYYHVHRFWLGSVRSIAGEADSNGGIVLAGNAFTFTKEAKEAVAQWRSALPSG